MSLGHDEHGVRVIDESHHWPDAVAARNLAKLREAGVRCEATHDGYRCRKRAGHTGNHVNDIHARFWNP